MITVKFEYNSETEVAVYWLYKDGVPYEMFEVKLAFGAANDLSQFFQVVISRSAEDSLNSVLDKLEKFVDSHF